MSKGKLLAVCCIWLVILFMGALVWRLIFPPPPWWEHEIAFALDSFSGYAVFRSEEFEEGLREKRIKLSLTDDGADYSQRIRALKEGGVQMAVFTVDALIKASAEMGDLDAVIVAVVDETIGADAMLADKDAIPNLDALNDPRTRFVLTPDSPSETLARVVIAHFKLDKLGDQPFQEAEGAEDVFNRYQNAPPDTHQVFVLWEPYVSRLLEDPDVHRVVDSGDFEGYIVDVIVANRDYLRKEPDVVASLVEAYLEALYTFDGKDEMIQLVLDDADSLGEPLTQQQAEKLVRGIWWKNSQENFAHMGLRETKTLQPMETIIGNITNVLKQTNGISEDPTRGKPDLLYRDTILRKLSHLHPEQEVRERKPLPPLTDSQARGLLERQTEGTLDVEPLVFARGRAELRPQSKLVLDELAQKLKTWPRYYVVARGDTLRDDDPEVYKMNEQLALQRAKAAERHLIEKGIPENRVYAIGGEPSGSTSVSFVLHRPPR
ncbi:MAG: OmpA family protein [Planctomycetes bacterium]|nr:OmpA family protein [Planctomycetota bacterium]